MAFLLDDLIVAPASMFIGVCQKIRDLAEEEAYGEEKLKQELLELQVRREMEELSEEQYLKVEAALMKRLELGQRRRG